MTSYDDRQASPQQCCCGRKVSNREHCRRWSVVLKLAGERGVSMDVMATTLEAGGHAGFGGESCPLETFHGRRYAQPDSEECE